MLIYAQILDLGIVGMDQDGLLHVGSRVVNDLVNLLGLFAFDDLDFAHVGPQGCFGCCRRRNLVARFGNARRRFFIVIVIRIRQGKVALLFQQQVAWVIGQASLQRRCINRSGPGNREDATRQERRRLPQQ